MRTPVSPFVSAYRCSTAPAPFLITTTPEHPLLSSRTRTHNAPLRSGRRQHLELITLTRTSYGSARRRTGTTLRTPSAGRRI
ncbi:hypothetical protein C8Q78DRAFT_1004966 [Trametes maxima]|nr:hypothetical protein C8Q78DRAFT_1004966 [Trametes maxima]